MLILDNLDIPFWQGMWPPKGTL